MVNSINSSPKRLLGLLAVQKQIRVARQDPNAFLEFCFHQPDGTTIRQAALHRALQAFLTQHRRALVELPRDHGKSTQVCARLVWELGHNPGLRIVLVCATEGLAAQRGRFLRDAVAANDRVKLVFPQLKPRRPWRVMAFAVERSGQALGPSVSAFGIGGSLTGNRADLLVCDDIVDAKALSSKAERDRVSDGFFNNLMNLLEPTGRFWNLSTPWHADDLNARLKHSGGYALFRKPVGRNFRPVWPERWGEAELKQRRREIGSAAFSRGYRLRPVADGQLLIRGEWIRFAERLPAYDRIILSVDPAVTGKADASGLVVLGLAGKNVHCLAAEAKHVNAPGLIEAIAEFDRQWNPEVILFESNGAFDAVRALLVRHASFGGKVKGVVQSTAKAARVAAFSVSVENGSFHLCGELPGLAEEMTAFPCGEHDDLLDAAATGTAYLFESLSDLRFWLL